MIGDEQCAAEALRLVAERDHRYALFPSEIFDEYPWNMLLHLFIALAQNRTISEATLCELSHAGRAVGKRWINHLVQDGQVEARADGTDVILTREAIARLRLYLSRIADRSTVPTNRA